MVCITWNTAKWTIKWYEMEFKLFMHFYLPHADVNLKLFSFDSHSDFCSWWWYLSSSILKTDMPCVECRLGFITWRKDLLNLKYFPQTETLNQSTVLDKRMKQDMWYHWTFLLKLLRLLWHFQYEFLQKWLHNFAGSLGQFTKEKLVTIYFGKFYWTQNIFNNKHTAYKHNSSVDLMCIFKEINEAKL